MLNDNAASAAEKRIEPMDTLDLTDPASYIVGPNAAKMTPVEIEVSYILQAIASGGVAGDSAGPILVRIAADVAHLIMQSASFPALLVEMPDVAALTAERDALLAQITTTTGAAVLTLADQVDDLDEKIENASIPTLRCPTCGETVEPDEIFAVDVAERQTPAESFQIEDGHGSASFIYDGDGNFDSVGYYTHGDTSAAHPVDLPEGWSEG